MKHHIMIALGILMGAIFSFNMANALIEPGFGLSEIYQAGGLIIAIYLIVSGLKERRYFKAKSKSDTHA